jgi:hypothetical protein
MRVRRWRLPESARGGGPPAGGCGGRGSLKQTRGVTVPRSRVAAAVPRSMAAASRSRGRATVGPLCGQAAAALGPEAAALPRLASKRRGGGAPPQGPTHGGRARGAPPPPRRASSVGVAQGTRFEQRHGRREVRASTITCDIL